MKTSPLSDVKVIVPNLKRRLSGVTATIARLLPVQSQSIEIVATGPGLPARVRHVPLRSVIFMSGHTCRVWHARRNTEMLLGLILHYCMRKRLKLLFTSASQRHHTRYTRFLISRMHAVIATSNRTASYLQRPARLIRHGVDTEAFRPHADRCALRLSLGLPGSVIIGCYGRIRPQKGTDVFVEAMLKTLPVHTHVTAIVMGRTTRRYRQFLQHLRGRVENAQLQDRILFLPEVPVIEMPERYQVLDLFVAPQRWEGFGVMPLEAMACGVPVVATTVGVFDELVVEGETGRLVSPGDVGQMSEALDDALVSPDRLRRWSTAARRRVERQFRIEDEADALNTLYRELLKG